MHQGGIDASTSAQNLLGTTLAPGDSATFTFDGTIANSDNLTEVNTLTVNVFDDEGNPVAGSDTSTVTTPNLILGTDAMEMLDGTPGKDIITGLGGMDMLTGGGGDDDFVYTSFHDQMDYIMDFQTGSDRLVLTDLLASETSFSGGDAIAQGYVNVLELGSSGTLVQADPDGLAGPGFAENMVFLNGVSAANGNAFNSTTDLIV